MKRLIRLLAACVLAATGLRAAASGRGEAMVKWQGDLRDGSERGGCRLAVDPRSARVSGGIALMRAAGENAAGSPRGLTVEFTDEAGAARPLAAESLTVLVKYSGLDQSQLGPFNRPLVSAAWKLADREATVAVCDVELRSFAEVSQASGGWQSRSARLGIPREGLMRVEFSARPDRRGTTVSFAARTDEGVYAPFETALHDPRLVYSNAAPFHSVSIGGGTGSAPRFLRADFCVEAVALKADGELDAAAFGARHEGQGRSVTPIAPGAENLVASPGVERVDFDWTERHRDVLACARRSPNPDVLVFGDQVAHEWAGRDSFGEPGEPLAAVSWRSSFGPNDRCYGFSLDRSSQLLWRMRSGERDGISPRVTVLCAGTSHLWPFGVRPATKSGEELAEAVLACVREAKARLPSTRLVVLGPLPCGLSGDACRTVVRDANRRLAEAAEDSGYVFVDPAEGLLDAAGNQIPFLWRSQMRLTEQGYCVLFKAIAPYVKAPEGIGREALAAIWISLAAVAALLALAFWRNRVLKREKRAAERANAAKTRFLFGISHDIRTPMNAMLGYVGLAAKEAKDNPKAAEYLRKASVAGEHLLSLLNDVLEMARIESGQLAPERKVFSLSEAFAEINIVAESLVRERGVRYLIGAGLGVDTGSWAIGDRQRLKQVLLNLLGNAVKFTPAGGTVTAACVRDGDDCVFTIKDTGCGMAPEFLEHLFEPFERERTATDSGVEGTGLGLAISSNLVKIMGGAITVRSEKGAGSEFTVRLPLPEAAPPAARA